MIKLLFMIMQKELLGSYYKNIGESIRGVDIITAFKGILRIIIII